MIPHFIFLFPFNCQSFKQLILEFFKKVFSYCSIPTIVTNNPIILQQFIFISMHIFLLILCILFLSHQALISLRIGISVIFILYPLVPGIVLWIVRGVNNEIHIPLSEELSNARLTCFTHFFHLFTNQCISRNADISHGRTKLGKNMILKLYNTIQSQE